MLCRKEVIGELWFVTRRIALHNLLYEQGERYPTPDDVGTSGRSRSRAGDIDLHRRAGRSATKSRSPITISTHVDSSSNMNRTTDDDESSTPTM